MKTGSIPESRGVRIRLCDGVCAFTKRRFYLVWYGRWMDRHPKFRRTIVAFWRPFAEMRVPCDLKSVGLGGYREVLGQVSLDRLEVWATWRKFSRRDLRAIKQEIARKRVLGVMREQYGYPTSAEIREYYKRCALGKTSDGERKAFEARLVIKP